MAKLHIRKYQHGQLLSCSTSSAVVDIYQHERQNDTLQEGETLLCLHWDRPRETSMTAVTVKEPDWNGSSAIDDRLYTSLSQDLTPLHQFLKDVYSTVGAQLVAVKLKPPVFVFVHSGDYLVINNEKRFMDILRGFLSKCVFPKPDIKVKVKFGKSGDPCVLLRHDFHSAAATHLDRREPSRDTMDDTDDTERRFAMLEDKMSQQRQDMETQLELQKKQLEEINTLVQRVLSKLQDNSSVTDTQTPEPTLNLASVNSEHCGNDSTNAEVASHANLVSKKALHDSKDIPGQVTTNVKPKSRFDQEDYDHQVSGSKHIFNSRTESASDSASDDDDSSMSGHDDDLPKQKPIISDETSETVDLHGSSSLTKDDESDRELHASRTSGGIHTSGSSDDSLNISQMASGDTNTVEPPLKKLTPRNKIEGKDRSGSSDKSEAADTGIGMSTVSPEDELIWTSVMDKLKDDRGKVPRADNVMATILCLDSSASTDHITLVEMKTLAYDFIAGIEDIAETEDTEENIGIVTFGGGGKVLHSPSNDYSSLRDAVESVTCSGSSPLLQGATVALACIAAQACIEAGVDLGAIEELKTPDIIQRIILLTDCRPSLAAEEHSDDTSHLSHMDRMAILQGFGKIGHEFVETKVVDFVWMPIGNSDRALMNTMATLTKGRVVESNEMDSLFHFQRIENKTKEIVQHVLQMDPDDLTEETLTMALTAQTSHLSATEQEEIQKRVVSKLQRADKEEDPENFENVNIEVGLPPLGSRVIRGADWKWEDQGGGEPGTVINHSHGGGSVVVLWDNGYCDVYRYGSEGCFDVLPDDGCPRQFLNGQTPEVGVQVQRGPDWIHSYGDQDGGCLGVIIRVNDGRVKVRWENGNIYDYRFGHEDKYDLIMRDAARCVTTSSLQTNTESEKEHTGNSMAQTAQSEITHGKPVIGWQRQNERKQWVDYSQSDNKKLMIEYNKGKNSCLISRKGKSYRVCFNLGVERSIGDGSSSTIKPVTSQS